MFVPPYAASERARALHETLTVADLHADSLLWGRDLLERGDAGPRRRPAPHRRQRRPPGPGLVDQVAAPPEHRAQRRATPTTSSSSRIASGWPPADLAEPARPGAPHGRPRRRHGRADPPGGSRSSGRRADLEAHLARADAGLAGHGRAPGDRGRARARRRPGQRRGRLRCRLPDDVAEPLLRQRVRRVGPRRREGRPHRRRATRWSGGWRRAG